MSPARSAASRCRCTARSVSPRKWMWGCICGRRCTATAGSARPCSTAARCCNWPPRSWRVFMSDVDARKNLGALADDDFRQRFRRWLEANYPAAWKQDAHRPFRRLRGDDVVHWLQLLHRDGWRAPAWPREYGGLGLSFRQQLIYHEELERVGAARVIDFGDNQLGPTLIQCGNAAQKAYFLPRILSGEHIWCQGYSEPGAGSDLA